jgi:Flp pilus assembly protein TadD
MAQRSRKKADFSHPSSGDSSSDFGVDALVARARTSARRGDGRKAFLLLERASNLASDDPRVWTLFAVQCQRMGKLEDATRSFRQAIWLRERTHDDRRVRVLQRLLSELRRELPAA